MILSEKQQIRFIDWYKSIYGDTSPKTGTWKLPKVPEEEQKEHVKMWVKFLKELMWPKMCKKTYRHRGGRKEDYLHLVFGNLYLNFWPTYIDKDCNVSEKYLWIDDVLDEC
jgi:hypothetical protein